MGCFSSTQKEEDPQVKYQSQSEKLKKIVFLGLEGAGKTSILQYLKTGHFCETQPTVGIDVGAQVGTNVETINYASGSMLVFDIGGGVKVRQLWPHYYDNLDGLVFVIDSTASNELDIVKEEIGKLVNAFRNQKSVLLIYFNKIDSEQSLDINWLLQETNLQQTDSDVVLQRCSAKTGQGIWEGIDKMNKLLVIRKN